METPEGGIKSPLAQSRKADLKSRPRYPAPLPRKNVWDDIRKNELRSSKFYILYKSENMSRGKYRFRCFFQYVRIRPFKAAEALAFQASFIQSTSARNDNQAYIRLRRYFRWVIFPAAWRTALREEAFGTSGRAGGVDLVEVL